MPSSTPFAARHVARLAGGFAGAGGFDDLADDDLGVVGALLQVVVPAAC
jgi:hypothetical protein